MTGALSPRVLRAWRNTLFEAEGVAARIGDRSVGMDRLLARMGRREAVIIGAWNPWARHAPEGVNLRMHRRMNEMLRELPRLDAKGGERRWSEHHFLVAIPLARAVVLARRFRQAGIVWVRSGKPLQLVRIVRSLPMVEM